MIKFVLLFLLVATPAYTQQLDATIYIQDTEPIASVGSFWLHSNGTLKINRSINPNVWVTIGGSSGSSIPSGSILIIESGTCPTDYAEVSNFNGVSLIGTIAANNDIGTSGGSDNITPIGTNSAPSLTMNSYTPSGTIGALTFTGTPLATHTHVFTGTVLATHQHELPFQKVAGGTGVLRMVAASIFGTGTSRAAESQSAAPVANTTAAVVLKDQAISAGTPSGTNASITAGTPVGSINTPTFTGSASILTGNVSISNFIGTSFDNRSSFKRVIYCKKN